MFLERLKTTDFDPSKKYTFVVSLGATEQHGPFLPLGTDSFIQDAIIQRVEKVLPEVVFLPTLRITCSKEHAGFPGSLWVEKETLTLMLQNICESLQPYAAQIIFASWHGGNISLLNRFVEKTKDSFAGVRIEHIPFDSANVLKRTAVLLGGPVDEHAGNSEISMVLACEAALVTQPSPEYPKQLIENAWDADRLADVSKDGIVDNHPAWVISERIGEHCLQMATEELAEGLRNLLNKRSL